MAKGWNEKTGIFVVPKGPLPDIQPLDDEEVSNGH